MNMRKFFNEVSQATRKMLLQKARLISVKKLGLPYDIAPDGTITVRGDVDLSKRRLEALPYLSGVIIEGNFDCSVNYITSLFGAPSKVTGNFKCSGNLLSSLKGAPFSVGKDFNCFLNKLTSLEGGPATVGGNYSCDSNELTTLTGVPRELNRLDCGFNPLLSFQGGPEKVGALICIRAPIESLEHAPREVSGDILVTSTKLKDLSHAPEKFRRLITDFGTFKGPYSIPLNLGGRPPPSVELKASVRIRKPLALKGK